MEEKISYTVLSVDKRVRFAGVVSEKGEVIEGGFQNEPVRFWTNTKNNKFTLTHCRQLIHLKSFRRALGT